MQMFGKVLPKLVHCVTEIQNTIMYNDWAFSRLDELDDDTEIQFILDLQTIHWAWWAIGVIQWLTYTRRVLSRFSSAESLKICICLVSRLLAIKKPLYRLNQYIMD